MSIHDRTGDKMKDWDGVDRRGESDTNHHYPDRRKGGKIVKPKEALKDMGWISWE